MLVSLYTVRIVLEALGAEDFGIFNVVGGIVVLFTSLNWAMTSATQRFLNFALGQNDVEQVRNVYSASLVIHVLVALLIVVLAQTVGLWFFYTWLNIPAERQTAAFVVYQFSVATAMIGVLQVPYRATIIAYEKMSFFATISIVEAVLRLGVVFLLPIILFDKLVVYAFLVNVTGIVVFLIHKVYCNRTFESARFRYCRDKGLFRQLLGFSGWNFFGEVANVSRGHGSNLLINVFHGVTVNAAMGIATQVNSAVYQFVSNFQVAFSPQIIKLYSAKEYDYFMRLIFRTAKMSFCLLFFFVLPLYINAEFVLRIWLSNVPEYAVVFTQLILLFSLVSAISGPLVTSIRATGDIKKYQIIISFLIFVNLPLSLLFLWLGFSPIWVLIVRIASEALNLIWRIIFLGGKIKLPVMVFFREVILPLFVIVVGTVFFTAFIQNLFIGDWSRLIVSCIVSIVTIGSMTYWIGLSRHERGLLQNWIKNRMQKKA